MGLFKVPKRPEQNIINILSKAQQTNISIPTTKMRGNTLLDAINKIVKDVDISLGSEKDNFIYITDEDRYIEYCKKAVEDGIVAIDTETTSLDSILADLVGICLYSPSQKSAYIPISHMSIVTEKLVAPQISKEVVAKGIQILKDGKTKNIFHNAYYDLVIIHQNLGIDLDVYWDCLVAAHALNENESHNLKDLYVKYILNGNATSYHFNDLFSGVPYKFIPYTTTYLYGAKDAIMTYELFRFQEEYLTVGREGCKEYSLENVARLYREDLLPMIPILVDMKLTGMELDFEINAKLKEKYERIKEEAAIEFEKSLEPFKGAIEEYNETHRQKPLPYPLNYNSSDQIRALFYDIAKIGVVYRKEPQGTGANVREAILNIDRFKGTPIREVAEKLDKVKEYDKVIGSFIDKLRVDAQEHNGKIHSNLKLAATVTGRLAASEP